jgi:hypothetical protein
MLLHLPEDRRQPIEIADFYFVEAGQGNTRVRTRRARTLLDLRQLLELLL